MTAARCIKLKGSPVSGVVREVMESAVKMGRLALEAIQVDGRDEIDRAEDMYRARDKERLRVAVRGAATCAPRASIITSDEREVLGAATDRHTVRYRRRCGRGTGRGQDREMACGPGRAVGRDGDRRGGVRRAWGEQGRPPIWLKTGGQYQLIHAVAALVALRMDARGPAALFVVGSALFAGSLYAMALGAPRWSAPSRRSAARR